MARRRTMTVAEAQHPDWTADGRGPDGRRLCRRCCQQVPPGRRTFCSEACVDWWNCRRSSSYLRRQVRLRDKGICCDCKQDTYALRREADAVRRRDGAEARRVFLRERGFDPQYKTYWQMDHIHEVADGGDLWEMSNLATRCFPCHQAKTKASAAERRARRRAP